VAGYVIRAFDLESLTKDWSAERLAGAQGIGLR